MKAVRAFAVLSTLVAAPLAAQGGIDMAAVQKWSQVRLVKYDIKGVYSGITQIASGPNNGVALGTVTDHLTLEVQLDVRKNAVIGTPKFTNAVSELGALSSGAAKCEPPVARGPYEHLDVSTATGGDGTVILQGMRRFPTVDASIEWPATCSRKPIAADETRVTETVAVPAPMMLVMPNGANPNMTVAADKKSFSIRANGWTWTYTPTVVH